MAFQFSVFLALTTTQMYVLFGVSLFVAVILVLLFNYFWNRVDESSQMIRELYLLNTSYKFHKNIKKHERFTKPCNSKSQFDKVNLATFFMGVIEKNIQYYDGLLSRIDANKMLFREYEDEYGKIKSTTTRELSRKYYMPLFVYKLIEAEMFRRRKANPRLDTEFIIRATYVSHKGKNAYQNTFTYNLKEAKRIIDLVHLQIERKKTKEYQRALMSDTLRWDVMHRDGFKCQLCGASAKDGTVLHVDHIIPVSKGGKTEKGNLRTLCDRCNLGKRDNIE